MPSKTDKQRRIFRAAMGAKEGQENVSGAAKKIAKDMSKKEIKKFLKKEEDSESIAKKVAKTGAAKFSKKAPNKRKKTAPPTQVQKSKKGKGSYSRKNKETIEESSILSFIDSILEKNYDDASKYLTSILNSKLQARIEKELATPLF